jgi:large subunit ribosomal protein L29
MNKKDLLEYRKKSLSENKKKLEKYQLKIAELRAEFASGSLKNPKQIKVKKIDIAQMKTVIREKDILETEKEIVKPEDKESK